MRQILTACLLAILAIGCKDAPREQAETITAETDKKIGYNYNCTPVVSDAAWYEEDRVAPLLPGLDVLDFSSQQEDTLVAKYINQGLILAYGFNHAEAARSFYYATKLDPKSAMAYWGYAYVLGPNYNAGMEADHYQRAYEAAQTAIQLAEEQADQRAIDLSKALALRYLPEPPEDRYQLDVVYAEAMKTVFETYPDDPDIGTLYAEAQMNLHKWDLFDKEGKAKEWTPAIEATLQQVFEVDPTHAGAHHFYIHVVESSNQPEKGLHSSKLFDEDLVPGAGHLVHMPSHIYIRTGDYHKGTVSNIRSVKVDSSYVSACNAQGAYPLAYFPHNYHFLVATATLEGNKEWAIHAADKLATQTNAELMKQPGWGTIQHYYLIPYYTYVKFGMWEEILALDNKVPDLKYPKAIEHYARGMAHLGLGNMEAAQQELAALEAYANDSDLASVTIWDINAADDLVYIAYRVLKGEVLASQGAYQEAIPLLQEAVAMEDSLNYNEPPDWFFSVRHHLGAVLNEAGMYQEAVATLEEDLRRLPKNGWALHGLRKAYIGLDQQEQIAEVDQKLATIWSTADIVLEDARIK